MAECVVARCVQERRFLKRELQKWGKNVLYLVGFERVAEELIGHDKWITLTQPLLEHDSSTKEVVDWSPDAKCCFCNNRRYPPLDPAKGVCSNGTINDGDKDWTEQGLSSYGGSRPSSPSSPDSDQPLDLSLGSKHRSHSPSSFNGDASGSTALLKVPQIPDKSGKLKRRLEATICKRSYTEDELQAALRDIRSGKLGTRRAAVIYGIPRSTLRNKVYKLALDKAVPDVIKIKAIGRDSKSLSMEDLIGNGTESGLTASESLRRLLRNRMAEKVESKLLLSEDAFGSSSLETNPALAPILSHMLANVHQLALSCQGTDSAKDLVSQLKLPLLPDLIRKLSEERFEEECNRQRPAAQKTDSSESSVILKIPSYKPVKTVAPNNGDTSAAGVSSQSGGGNNGGGGNNNNSTSSSNGTSSNGTKGIGVTLREIIAKSITQRANSKSATSNGDAKLRSSNSTPDPPTPHHVTRSSTVRASRSGKESKLTSVTLGKPEKRVRPKRGRYRNYDRDNLVEAVRAVQRGEMSVHRAGSFFGVPHSTLEYKVKERHLLRPRKHRGGASKAAKRLPAPGGKSRSSSSSNSSCSNSNASTTSSAKGAASTGSTAGTSSAGAATSSGLWQNSPLFALDFNRLNSSNFFASQMMRKLQEDALMQGHGTDSLSSRDALLLGVLIRNGLQAAEAGNSK